VRALADLLEGLVGEGWGSVELQAVGDAAYETAGIEQMLGTEMALRPAAAGFELDAEEVADFAEHAILHDAGELAVGIADAEVGALRYGAIHLQAGSGEGNILQVRDPAASPAAFVLPLDVHEVGAEHPWFDSPIHHILLVLIGGSFQLMNPPALEEFALSDI